LWPLLSSRFERLKPIKPELPVTRMFLLTVNMVTKLGIYLSKKIFCKKINNNY
jgi:hypothetical protein